MQLSKAENNGYTRVNELLERVWKNKDIILPLSDLVEGDIISEDLSKYTINNRLNIVINSKNDNGFYTKGLLSYITLDCYPKQKYTGILSIHYTNIDIVHKSDSIDMEKQLDMIANVVDINMNCIVNSDLSYKKRDNELILVMFSSSILTKKFCEDLLKRLNQYNGTAKRNVILCCNGYIYGDRHEYSIINKMTSLQKHICNNCDDIEIEIRCFHDFLEEYKLMRNVLL